MENGETEGGQARVVFLHGFTREEAVALMRAAKAVLPQPENLAFAMATPNNLEWKVSELVSHVSAEHAYMKEHGVPKPD